MKRGGPLKRGGRLRRRNPVKAADDRQYSRDKAEYLRAHPLCQICMAFHRIDEVEALRRYKIATDEGIGAPHLGLRFTGENGSYVYIPLATDIHHRNKRHSRIRLLEKRFWMAASRSWHEIVEGKKDEARSIGVLCKIQTDENGYLPDGSRYLFTEDLLAVRARGEDRIAGEVKICST